MRIRPEQLLAFDIEASGLHPGSYPIQLGWCGLDLVPKAFYLRRPESWTDRDWSWESEKIHGISRPDLQKVGIDVRDAASRLLAAYEGRVLVSDNPWHENQWLARFHEEAGIGPVPRILHVHQVLDALAEAFGADPTVARDLPKAVRSAYPHTHSADDDALSLAAALKAIADPVFGAPFMASARDEEPDLPFPTPD